MFYSIYVPVETRQALRGVMLRWRREDSRHFNVDWLSGNKAVSWEFSDLPGTVPDK